jgi:uncharacterized protein YcbK (DUF882 family)
VAGITQIDWRLTSLRALAILAGLLLFFALSAPPQVAAAGNDRTLWLYHTHTGKTGKFTYMRNGKYDTKVLNELNIFLADWRTGTSTKMDPKLFDLLWEVYQDVRGTKPYHIVSSYREPKTNAMLASKSSGVAENSQHMTGKAMDVFIPGVKLADLRAAAMRHQVGGVGYYPTSGSPFVHMDTGSVRAWPRMTRAQLKDVFPDGRTLHLPVDGTPLSKDGRAYAQAQWNKCRMVPCGGAAPVMPADKPDIMIAALDPAQRTVSTISVGTPVPLPVVAFMPSTASTAAASTVTTVASAPPVIPMAKPHALMVATLGGAGNALGALAAVDTPAPRVLMTPRDQGVLTAYAPEIAPDPEAQRALEILIQREVQESGAEITLAASATEPAPVQLASLDAGDENLFDMTWTAVSEAGARENIVAALTTAALETDPMDTYSASRVDFVAPVMDHVTDTLVAPVPMTDMHFAEFYAPEGYLDNAANLGALAGLHGHGAGERAIPRYDVFVQRQPALLVAAR